MGWLLPQLVSVEGGATEVPVVVRVDETPVEGRASIFCARMIVLAVSAIPSFTGTLTESKVLVRFALSLKWQTDL